MVSLLNRKQFVYQLKEMFYQSDEFIYLICPYIDISNNEYFLPAFDYANKKQIDINIIYSQGRKEKNGINHLKQYDCVKLCYISQLHMKVYLCDKFAIVGSLNLYDFSVKNNLECGLLISRDESLWKDIYNMIKKDIYKCMVIEKKRTKKKLTEKV